jgi:hypothetical protein
MPYTIEDKSNDIIVVTYSGEVGLEERVKVVDEVCLLAAKLDAVKLLINVTLVTQKMTHDEQEYFGNYLSERNELKNAKVAVVHGRKSHPNIIINAVAYSKGYLTVDFSSNSEAIAWLNGEFK